MKSLKNPKNWSQESNQKLHQKQLKKLKPRLKVPFQKN